MMKSYRMSVSYADIEKLMSDTFRPSGIGCRRFFKPKVNDGDA